MGEMCPEEHDVCSYRAQLFSWRLISDFIEFSALFVRVQHGFFDGVI